MKSRIPNDFFVFVQKYTLESMIYAISSLSYDIYQNPSSEMGLFGRRVFLNKSIKSFLVIQTWLIDLIYELIQYNHYGNLEISQNDTIKLIRLYNNYLNKSEKKHYNKNNIMLYLYGFFGEQKRFQEFQFFNDYARESYILEDISKKFKNRSEYVDVVSDFIEETSLKPNEYSAYLFMIHALFTQKSAINNNEFKKYCMDFSISYDNIIEITKRYAIDLNGIRKSSLGRQVLYTNPIIKIENTYLSANPFLMLSLFTNSNFWILRNRYKNRTNNESQKFISAFGIYFEEYVKELLERCVGTSNFQKIQESNAGKRADWKLHLCEFNILVEQKSSIPIITIKQNHPNLQAMDTHIKKIWGEAVKQLEATEQYYGLNNCIKIILVYDDYFKAECLEELFKQTPDLTNDGNYWLINIREFEHLLMLYYYNKEQFKIVMCEKIQAERTYSSSGRELFLFFEKHNIVKIDYLAEFGIYDKFKRIKDFYKYRDKEEQ